MQIWDYKCNDYVDIYDYDNEKKIARVRLYIIRNKLHNKPYGLIEDLYVDDNYRHKGIGKKLIKELIYVAKSYECYKIIATSRFSREYVHKFYEDLGLEKYGYEFRMDL